MFESINDYMTKSLQERKKHLQLDEECIEIGGLNSTYYKGLLAHHLNTTIPTKEKVFLCHACNNPNCSNPNHLYWGSPKENYLDQVERGTFDTIPNRAMKKYGKDQWNKMLKEGGKKGGINGGGSNKLSEEEIESRKQKIEDIDFGKRGSITKASKILGISHTQMKRFLETYHI